MRLILGVVLVGLGFLVGVAEAQGDGPRVLLDDFEKELRWFVKVMPTDYRRVLEHQAEIEERARQLAERQAGG